MFYENEMGIVMGIECYEIVIVMSVEMIKNGSDLGFLCSNIFYSYYISTNFICLVFNIVICQLMSICKLE